MFIYSDLFEWEWSDAICLVRWAALIRMCYLLKLEIHTVKFRK